MIHEVYRPIEADKGEILEPGTLVETSSWRNEKALLDQGRIGPVRKDQKSIKRIAKEHNVPISEIATSSGRPGPLKVPAKPPRV